METANFTQVEVCNPCDTINLSFKGVLSMMTPKLLTCEEGQIAVLSMYNSFLTKQIYCQQAKPQF